MASSVKQSASNGPVPPLLPLPKLERTLELALPTLALQFGQHHARLAFSGIRAHAISMEANLSKITFEVENSTVRAIFSPKPSNQEFAEAIILRNVEEVTSHALQVPSKLLGGLIGQKGDTAKQLRTASKCYIAFPAESDASSSHQHKERVPSGADMATVKLIGTQPQIDSAISLIESKMAELTHHRSPAGSSSHAAPSLPLPSRSGPVAASSASSSAPALDFGIPAARVTTPSVHHVPSAAASSSASVTIPKRSVLASEMMVDIGINLCDKDYRKDVFEVAKRAFAAGVGSLIVTGSTESNSAQAVELCKQINAQPDMPFMFSTAGIHPHQAKHWNDSIPSLIRRLVTQDSVCAVGECGLDFFRDLSPRDVQERVFIAHLELAVELQLPLFLHVRSAFPRFFEIITPYLPRLKAGGVVHCFTGTVEEAAKCLELPGFYLGFTGKITTKSAIALLDIAASIPLDRIMIETDGPYHMPSSKAVTSIGGRRNEPANIGFVASAIAERKGIPLPDFVRATTKNVATLFTRTAQSLS